ncbi:auxin-responsive protein SAUR71-like [Impatiens glandulifera]|uniref:auxin-responsive protein SAUR71-like n=1 Tax=Impatiens glandulifera TaxID=253017 RepID=UPI001FB04CB8|nr:auxin-responsive protein SAUR71-like [Impatiens glandulifera]
MKKLIKRLSRVSDSSQYFLLRTDCVGSTAKSGSRSSVSVPEGHFPVYVGEEMERFVVSADLLNYPIFVKLLNKSAQEYGYEQKGVLRIPCHVIVFERIIEAFRLADESPDTGLDLLNSLADEFL